MKKLVSIIFLFILLSCNESAKNNELLKFLNSNPGFDVRGIDNNLYKVRDEQALIDSLKNVFSNDYKKARMTKGMKNFYLTKNGETIYIISLAFEEGGSITVQKNGENGFKMCIISPETIDLCKKYGFDDPELLIPGS